MRLSARLGGTMPSWIFWARPSTMAVLPTPASPSRIGLFLRRRLRIWTMRSTSASRPMRLSKMPRSAISERLRANSERSGCSFFFLAIFSSLLLSSRISLAAMRSAPASFSRRPARQPSSRSMPSSRCSAPTCLWLSLALSAVACWRMCLTSSSMGMSMLVLLGVIFLSLGVSAATRRSRRLLTCTPMRSRSWVLVFSDSRRRPSRRWPLWMLSAPNWLAS